MIGFLARRFIRDYQNVGAPEVRTAYGVLCGAVGIVINLLLFALKLLAGTLAGSVAVTADAFNNLSDAGASIVTLLGFRLAGQKPDTEHPFGHGRLEYVSGLIVALVILLMGVELLRDAVSAIVHPETVVCSALTVTILLVSIAAKFYMYCYNRAVGKKIGAAAMQATAADSLSDCAATAAVLLSTLAGHFFGWKIDGWCGLAVSLLILWAGYQAARDTLSPLLGQPPTEEFVQRIRDIVMANETICGVHDLVVHDYGPGRVMISLHAEVPAHGDILAMHDEIDNVERELREKLGCEAVIHMDPIVTDDETVNEKRREIDALVHGIDESISIHDFRMVTGPTHTNIIFDAVVPYGCRLTDREAEEQIKKAVRGLDERYYAIVQIDKSYVR